MKYYKEDFKKEILPNNKVIYKHIKSGEKRDSLLKDCLRGKITNKQMNEEAKKLKYLYSEDDYVKKIG